MARCDYEARLGTPDSSSGRGLGNAIGDGIEQGMRLAELKSLCMRSKGYVLEAVR